MKESNRTTVGRGVSFPTEVSEAIDKRIAELAPWVRGLSDYINALVREDLTRGTLTPIPLVGVGKS